MSPRPGDPPTIRTPDAQEEMGEPMEIEHQTEAQKHHRMFINFEDKDLDLDNENLRRTVLYWKSVAETLRAGNVPLHVNQKNRGNIDPTLLSEFDALDDFLDELIPLEGCGEPLIMNKLRILISGAEDTAQFTVRMKELDFSLKCNEIWENDSVAYRCNTCALTPCMSLCADCFISNGHAGHDFTRFFSREGGACDCGNVDVLHPSGFCERHGPAAMAITRSMPPVALAEYIYVKLITRIFIFLRGFWRKYQALQEPKSISALIAAMNKETAPTINFIQACVNAGGPMRTSMTKILTDPVLYEILSADTGSDYIENSEARVLLNLDFRTGKLLGEDVQTLIDSPLVLYFDKELKGQEDDFMECETLLHEFIFWILRLHFPQNAINFILSMLSDPDYLNMMSLRFFKWYPLTANIMKMLCQAVQDQEPGVSQHEVSQVASRIIHVSVQMLSSSALCTKMNKQCDLVNTVFRSAHYLLGWCNDLSECFLDTGSTFIRNIKIMPEEMRNMARSRVILADINPVIINHGYWFVMGDIQNVMSHSQLAVETVLSPAFTVYLKIAYLMQGMNTYWRIVSGDHAQNDNGDQAQRTFTMEYETLSITMFNFVMAILGEKHTEAAQGFFIGTLGMLREWIKDMIKIPAEEAIIPFTDVKCCPAFSFTVHLPLHRHLSTAISHFTGMNGLESLINALREEEAFLRLVCLHPIRIHVFRAEHHTGMWVRNGHQLRIQSMLYAQPHINASFFQPDLDMIRFCAANVKAEWFIFTLYMSFHLTDCFKLEILFENGETDPKQEKDEDNVPGRYSPDPSGSARERISQRDYNMVSGKKQIYWAENALKEALNDAGLTFPENLGPKALKQVVEKVLKEGETSSESIEFAAEAGKWQELYDAFTKINQKLKEDTSLMKLIRTLHDLQNKQDRIIRNDWSRISKEPGGTTIEMRWRQEKSLILRRTEWIDPLLQNCLLLIAELITVRINCGATEKEAMRMEMVHELANGKLKYSHIRQCIADKGQRSCNHEDFNEILEQIADYHEPDEGAGQQLQQGGYTLKKEIWHTDFCPVFAQMRATLPGRGQESLFRAEKHDLEKLPINQRSTSLWIPYRLYEPGLTRHESVDNIHKILFNDRFTQLALLTLECRRNNLAFLSENSYQMIIYLISIAAHEGGYKHKPERKVIYERFARIYKLKMDAKETYDISLLQSIYTIFMSVVLKKGNTLEMLEKVLSRDLYEERIIGGEIEYLTRLLSVLVTYDHTTRFLIETELKSQKELKMEEDAKVDREMERKLAQKRKREAFMEKERQKGAKLMEKHRVNEGLSQDDVNAMDITTHHICRYDCPICGDNDVPSTLRNPMGMMAIITPNNLANIRVSDKYQEPTLVESLKIGEITEMKKKDWDYQAEQDLATINTGIYGDNVQGPYFTTEIQTCGHTAHIECFRLFHQSQTDALRHDLNKINLFCPLCRAPVEAIIPMKIDAEFAISDLGSFEGNDTRIFEIIKKCITHWSDGYTNNDKDLNFNDHYGDKTDFWMDKMDPQNLYDRKNHDSQTNLVALIRAAIERNMIYRQMGVPERRKNAWILPIMHLIPALTFRSTARNEDMCSAALRDLFVPERIKLARSNSDSILQRDTSPMTPPEFDFEEAMSILSSSPAGERNLGEAFGGDAESIINKRRFDMMEGRKQPFRTDRLLTQRSDVPLLLFDFRLLFLRISCYVVDNVKLSTHDKKTLLLALTKRIVRAGGIKAAVLMLYRLTPKLCQQVAKDAKENNVPTTSTDIFLKYTIRWYKDSIHMLTALQSSLVKDEFSYNDIQLVYQEINKNVKDLDAFCLEFICSCGLGINREDLPPTLTDFSDIQPHVKPWCRFFNMTLQTTSYQPNVILHRRPLNWKVVNLLQPPKLYDDLFSRMYKKKCPACDKVPQVPFVCMHCGKLVCFDDCCRITNENDRSSSLEVNRHSESCVEGVGIYLALNAAVVVIVKRSMSAIWGSIYLDAHGEEDKNLRRGKQLFLSDTRFKILQNDWMTQNFDRVINWYPPTVLNNAVRSDFD